VTIAFGIRNILPRTDAYSEILRVLAPGGRLCILEFGTGQARIWQGAYNFYLGTVLPRIGRFFSKNPEAYQYLADTILAFPHAPFLAGELRDAGFEQVGFQALSSGIVYIHVAQKPSLTSGPPQLPSSLNLLESTRGNHDHLRRYRIRRLSGCRGGAGLCRPAPGRGPWRSLQGHRF
jgi:SAM-dependent methyltransferase